MAVQRFMALVGGFLQQIEFLVSSSGSADGGKGVATDETTGKLHPSVMPDGFGENIIPATASETIGNGRFVNFHNNAGTFSIRLADNTNGRRADGFVLQGGDASDVLDVYPLDATNSELSALTPDTRYYLGTAGQVIASPLDPLDEANDGKLHQYLGYAKSATELITDDAPIVVI